MTLKVGLIGRGITASRSPAMHMAEARAQGINLRYDLFDTAQDDRSLAELLDYAQAAGYCGLNITHPFKQSAIGLLDALSDTAARIGAVNTVVFDKGQRIGHNTDCAGFAAGFRESLPDVALDQVLLVGAGGAGRAVAHALVDLGASEVLIHDRDTALSCALAKQVGQRARMIENIDAIKSVSGVVNATPMGMQSHPGSAVPAAMLRPDFWVADVVYFPLETQLLREARTLGCATLSGAGMAVHQAAFAFELFTNLPSNTARMRAVFEAM